MAKVTNTLSNDKDNAGRTVGTTSSRGRRGESK